MQPGLLDVGRQFTGNDCPSSKGKNISLTIMFIRTSTNGGHGPVCRAWQLHAQENLQQIEVHPKS